MTGADPSLEAEAIAEARLFSRYILGADPPAAFAARYADAVRRLFPSALPPSDARVLRFAVARPWSLPLLDAATGLLARESALHRRLLLMSGILEASPDFAERFLPRPASAPSLALLLFGAGASSAMKLALGLPLFLIVRRAS